MVESLEPRQLFSGVVTVTSNYGPEHRLLIQGDDSTNEIRLEAIFSNSMEEEAEIDRLTVFGSRLVIDGVIVKASPSGVATEVLSYGYRGDTYGTAIGTSPIIDLGGGNDVLLLIGDTNNSFGNVKLVAGGGNDRVTADGGFASLDINCGFGDDRVTVRGRTGSDPYYSSIDGVRDDLAIATGEGKDRIDLFGGNQFGSEDFLRIGGRLRIGDNAGSTRVSLTNVRVKHAATVALGRANDTILFANTVFRGQTRLLTRAGNDVVRFSGNVVVPDIASALQLGPGGDTFEAERFYDDFVG